MLRLLATVLVGFAEIAQSLGIKIMQKDGLCIYIVPFALPKPTHLTISLMSAFNR